MNTQEILMSTEKANVAFNNTYAKGINPESVEKMKKALDRFVDLIEHGMDADNFCYEQAREALTAAKL